MRIEVIRILRQAYQEYGNSVFCDNKRLEAYLTDLLVEYPVERKRICLAIEENVVSRIIEEFTTTHFYKPSFYVNTLQNTYGLSLNYASDLVDMLYNVITGSGSDEEIDGLVALRSIYGITYKDAYEHIKNFSSNYNISVDYLLAAYFYHCGYGTDKNLKIALKLYEHVISSNSNEELFSDSQKLIIPWAKNNLALILKENSVKHAITLLEESLNEGVAIAAYNLAKIYRKEALKVDQFGLKISLLKSADDALSNVLMNRVTTIDGKEVTALKNDYIKCAELAYKNSLNIYSAKSIEAFVVLKKIYGPHISLQNVSEQKYFIADEYLPSVDSIPITELDKQLETCKEYCEEYKQKSITYAKLARR